MDDANQEDDEFALAEFVHDYRNNQHFREEVLYEIGRMVGKLGSPEYSGAFRTLADSKLLTLEEVIELMKEIQIRGKRYPTEWRPYFDASFPQWSSQIPPLPRGYWIGHSTGRLFSAIYPSKDIQQVLVVFQVMRDKQVTIREMGMLWDASFRGNSAHIVGEGEVIPHWNKVSWLDVARKAGSVEIENLLKSVGFCEVDEQPPDIVPPANLYKRE